MPNSRAIGSKLVDQAIGIGSIDEEQAMPTKGQPARPLRSTEHRRGELVEDLAGNRRDLQDLRTTGVEPVEGQILASTRREAEQQQQQR